MCFRTTRQKTAARVLIGRGVVARQAAKDGITGNASLGSAHQALVTKTGFSYMEKDDEHMEVTQCLGCNTSMAYSEKTYGRQI